MTPLKVFEIGLALVALFVLAGWCVAWLTRWAVREIQTRHVVLDECPRCGQDMDFHREHNGCGPRCPVCRELIADHRCFNPCTTSLDAYADQWKDALR